MLGFVPIGALPLGGAPVLANITELSASDVFVLLADDSSSYVVLVEPSEGLVLAVADLALPVDVRVALAEAVGLRLQEGLSVDGSVMASDTASIGASDTRTTLAFVARSDVAATRLVESISVFGEVAASDQVKFFLTDPVELATLVMVLETLGISPLEYIAVERRLKAVSALVSIGVGEAKVRIRPN